MGGWGDGEMGRWGDGEMVIEDFEKGTFNNRIWYKFSRFSKFVNKNTV